MVQDYYKSLNATELSFSLSSFVLFQGTKTTRTLVIKLEILSLLPDSSKFMVARLLEKIKGNKIDHFCLSSQLREPRLLEQ